MMAYGKYDGWRWPPRVDGIHHSNEDSDIRFAAQRPPAQIQCTAKRRRYGECSAVLIKSPETCCDGRGKVENASNLWFSRAARAHYKVKLFCAPATLGELPTRRESPEFSFPCLREHLHTLQRATEVNFSEQCSRQLYFTSGCVSHSLPSSPLRALPFRAFEYLQQPFCYAPVNGLRLLAVELTCVRRKFLPHDLTAKLSVNNSFCSICSHDT